MVKRIGHLIGRAARVTAGQLNAAGFGVADQVAKTWGRMLGGVETRDGELTIFTGLPEWSFGRGGTCVGGVMLTAKQPSSDVIAHEKVHVAQWRRYGLLFVPLYLAAGRDPFQNRFEIEAGLAAGGYRKGTPYGKRSR